MENLHSISKIIRRYSEFRYKVVLEGICVGALAGLIVVLFRVMLEKAEHFIPNVIMKLDIGWWAILLLFTILLVGAFITTLLLKWEPMISGSGIPQVEGEILGYFQPKWWRVLVAKFIGGIITIGSGLSLGREGPSIQLGAMVGKGFSKATKRIKTEEKLLITCGASAGVAAAFNAPLAGALFSLEEVHKSFSVEVLLSSMAASITSDFVSRYVFGLKPVFDFSGASAISLSHFWIVILVGVIVGIVGVFHNICIKKVQGFYDKMNNPFIRTGVPFFLAGVFAIFLPIVLGGGSQLIMVLVDGLPLLILCIIFVVKFVFSITSFCSGVPGGIFLPLLVMGSLCGGIIYEVLSPFNRGLNIQDFIILGMVGAFASIVRAPVTGILLITEMTGNFTHLLFLSLVAIIAYITADMFHSKPIYDQLLEKMVKKMGISHGHVISGEKILIEKKINVGSKICNKSISQVELPERCLIVSVQREGNEIVPNGNTVMKAGDILVALCDEFDSVVINHALENQCKKIIE